MVGTAILYAPLVSMCILVSGGVLAVIGDGSEGLRLWIWSGYGLDMVWKSWFWGYPCTHEYPIRTR